MPFGQAILFMLLFAASAAIGVIVLAYAARCVLVVVQETGQGEDAIVWPGETYVDWLGHAVLFLELVGIWVAPGALAARMLRHVWLPEEGPLRILLLVGPGLWLFFPVGLLSSLSALSRWTPFRLAIVARLLRIAPATIGFYLLSAFVLLAAVVPWYYALFVPGWGTLLAVAAVVGAAVLFVYARLLGRLAWLVSKLPESPRSPRSRKTKASGIANVIEQKPHKKTKAKRRSGAKDPWAIPEEDAHPKSKRLPWSEDKPPAKTKSAHEPPSAYEIEAYGFAADQPSEPPQPIRRSPTSEEEEKPLEMQEAPALAPPPETHSDTFAEEVRRRVVERERSLPAPPPHPFFSGVFTFPLYAACLPNCLALSLGLLAEGVLLKALLALGHELFGW